MRRTTPNASAARRARKSSGERWWERWSCWRFRCRSECEERFVILKPPEPRGRVGWAEAVEDGEGSDGKERDSCYGNLFHAESAETWRRGDAETRRRGDAETRR